MKPPSRSARVFDFLIEVNRPLFPVYGLAVRLFFGVFLAWWSNPLLDRWTRKDFSEDIKLGIPSLFELHGARVISDPKPQANESEMDYLCFASATLIFKFHRWHNENYGVQIAPTFAPTEFCDLLSAQRMLDGTTNIKEPMLETSWHFWGLLLEPRFHLLEEAFDKEHFPETKSRLAIRLP